MNWIDALQRSIDYLENHLESPFKMEDAAAEANVSVFHFQRIFLVLTDMSVMEYVRRRRLSGRGPNGRLGAPSDNSGRRLELPVVRPREP